MIKRHCAILIERLSPYVIIRYPSRISYFFVKEEKEEEEEKLFSHIKYDSNDVRITYVNF